MGKILVAYATMAGSTAEVAQAIRDELAKSGAQVDVLPVAQVKDITPYDGVVLGGPMIMGWHRAASGFLRKHRKDLQRIPFAVFMLAMSLTQTANMSLDGVSLYIDDKLPKPPAKADRMTFKERYATLSNYIAPVLRAARPALPASIGVFGGRLEYGRLKVWAVLFAMLIIQAPAGDRRNWDLIREWAADLPEKFK